MRARFYDHQSGLDVVAFFGASITDADVILNDGKSLERVGVVPDQILLPTADQLVPSRFRCQPGSSGA